MSKRAEMNQEQLSLFFLELRKCVQRHTSGNTFDIALFVNNCIAETINNLPDEVPEKQILMEALMQSILTD